MSLLKKTRFVFSMTLGLVALFACTTPIATNINIAASLIADFDLPLGYTAEFRTSILGYTVEAYKGPNAPSHLYLIQSEKESDGKGLARMLAQLVPGSADADMMVIENRTATVRGQETTLIISEGVNSENVSYRQVTVPFEGKGGPALLLFSESVEDWDQEAVDMFIASIQ
jgi:hypothetical protein